MQNLERQFLMHLWGDELQAIINIVYKVHDGKKITRDEKEILDLILIKIKEQFDNPVNATEIQLN